MDLLTGRISVLAFFVVLVTIEAYWLIGRRKETYPWRHAVASVGVSIGRRLFRLATLPIIGAIYMGLYDLRPWSIGLDEPIAWLGLFIGVEFIYYWFHRWSHEVRWLWATHNAHHSSTVLNFPSAVRLGWTGFLSGGWLLWTPLAVLGYHPLGIGLLIAANLTYQLWLHTDMIPQLGPLEWVLNTPSHHRVHHAINAPYLDRNYGGVVIVFDRLFGTFTGEQESEPCRYGLVDANPSLNPFVIALREWGRIAVDVWRARTWRDRALFALGRPGWSPDGSRTTTAMVRAKAGLR